MASTTTDTETELSAVNAILGAIGQSPITNLEDGRANPEVGFIYNLLRDSNVDVQNEGWHFNTEKHVQFKPDSSTNKIEIDDNILKMDVTDGWSHRQYDVVKRNGNLYDKFDHTDDWSDLTDDGIYLDLVRLFTYTDLPSVFKRYVIYKAATRAATQLVGNPQLTQLLAQQELLARSAVMEYECNQGNHTMLGLPEDSVYHSYKPYRSLRR
tara:strand:- start:5805 stop:6437 length:633 start_codon:yes stop_codon:yes gene_type:complete